MTGDANLLVTVFTIGFGVFGLVFIGGAMILRNWWNTSNRV
jgi:hypothetical protein